MPIDRLGIPIVTREHRFGPVCRKVVYLQGCIVTSSHVSFVVWRESQVSNWVFMGLDMSYIVEIGLPKLDNTIMIGRDKPLFAV